MNIRINNNLEIGVECFVKRLYCKDFEHYTADEDEIKAFCKGVCRALTALGVDDNTVSDVKESFEYRYYLWED